MPPQPCRPHVGTRPVLVCHSAHPRAELAPPLAHARDAHARSAARPPPGFLLQAAVRGWPAEGSPIAAARGAKEAQAKANVDVTVGQRSEGGGGHGERGGCGERGEPSSPTDPL
eukprot:3923933-Prymnesium_polylepis.2